MWDIIFKIICISSATAFGIWFIIQKYFKELWRDMKTDSMVANIIGGTICFGIGSVGIAVLVFIWIQELMDILK